ncbi:MAG: IS21 family transposase [Parabacteroides sp.]|nr:IS21 family transposase [Parabacteroides sp.]
MKVSMINVIKSIIVKRLEGKPYSKIGTELSITKSTVNKYLSRVQEAGISLEQAGKMEEKDLELIVRKDKVKTYKEPDYTTALNQLNNTPHATKKLLFEQYRQEQGQSICSYSTFCRQMSKVEKSLEPKKLYCNIERVPGGSMEIDFAGKPMEWIDTKGKRRKARIFVCVLSYSQYTFAMATEDEKQDSWIKGCVEALSYFGGAPKTLVMDNAKALVTRFNGEQTKFSGAVRGLCNYYGMEPIACKPRSPKGKPLVENAVSHVYRSVIAKLHLEGGPPRVRDLDELNRLIQEKLGEFNQKRFTNNPLSSRQVEFNEHERPCLQGLPAQAYERPEWKVLTVDQGHCVRLQCDRSHRYSVPAQYVGQTVLVILSEDKVTILDPNTMAVIGEHQRYYNATGVKTHLSPEHLTRKERYFNDSKQHWVHKMIRAGYDKELAQLVIDYRWEINRGYVPKFVDDLVKLTEETSLDIAQRALSSAYYGKFLNIKSILQAADTYSKQTLLQFEFAEPQYNPEWKTPNHENVRNNYGK